MSDTVTVRRGGSYLTIPSLAIDRYLAKGYDVVDDSGNVLKASVPNDLNVLKKAYENHIAEINRLKEEIAQLKAQPKSEPSKQEKLFKEEVVKEPEIEKEETVEKKTTSKRSRKSV